MILVRVIKQQPIQEVVSAFKGLRVLIDEYLFIAAYSHLARVTIPDNTRLLLCYSDITLYLHLVVVLLRVVVPSLIRRMKLGLRLL